MRYLIALLVVIGAVVLYLNNTKDDEKDLPQSEITESQDPSSPRRNQENTPEPEENEWEDLSGRTGEDLARMRNSCIVGGLVVDENNKPVAKAAVVLQPIPWDSGLRGKDKKERPPLPDTISLTTDDQGKFSFPRVDRPVEFWVSARSADNKRAGQLRVLASGDLRGLLVPIYTGSTLVGQVSDLQGNPLPGITVGVAHTDLWNPSKPEELANGDSQAITDKDGKFELHGLQAGEFFVQAIDEGWVIEERQPIIIAKGETLHAELFASQGLSIKGSVTDAKGNPVVEAFVVVKPDGGGWRSNKSGGTTLSQKDGTFEVTGLKRGRYTVYVQGGYTESASAAEQLVQKARTTYAVTKRGVIAGEGQLDLKVSEK